MMTKLLLPFLLLFFMLDGLGQITFEKNIIGLNNDFNESVAIKSSPENGFMIAGNQTHLGIKSVFLLKTNQFGDTLWIKNYSQNDYLAIDLIDLDTLNDGYILHCFVTTNLQIKNILLIRTDLDGELIWNKVYNSPFSIITSDLIKTDDGGYAVSGMYNNIASGIPRYFTLIKTDEIGSIQWEQKYSDSQINQLNSFPTMPLIQLFGYYYVSYGQALIKLDENGYVVESKQILNNNSALYFENIAKSKDNKILIASWPNVIKMDIDGTIIWNKSVGYYDEFRGDQIFQSTQDGGCLLNSWTPNCYNSGCELTAHLTKFDGNGNTIFRIELPQQFNQSININSVVETLSKEYAFVVLNDNVFKPDFIKLDSLGISSCTASFPINLNNDILSCTSSLVSTNFNTSNSFTESTINLQTDRFGGRVLTQCSSYSNLNTNNTTYVSACGSYSLNGQTYTSSGDYTQLIQNQNGTFDTLSLVLDIIDTTYNTIYVTACLYYNVYNVQCEDCDALYINEPGLYPNARKYQNAAGCDSLVSVDLTIYNWNNAEVINNFNVLEAPQSGASYQWYDCATDSVIVGETNQSFVPTQNGNYAVQITIGDCSDRTNCYEYAFVELPEMSFEIYPNPFMTETSIVFNIPQTNTKIQLLDVLGKELQSVSFSGTEYTIYRESLSASMYFVQITDASGKVATRKIVLE